MHLFISLLIASRSAERLARAAPVAQQAEVEALHLADHLIAPSSYMADWTSDRIGRNRSDFDVIPFDREQEFTDRFNGKNKKWRNRKHSPNKRGMKLWVIFKKMELTEDQMNAIKRIMKQYFNCKKRVWMAAQDMIRRILADANRQRARIMAAVRSGDLNKGQAKKMLKELNEQTKMRIHRAIDQEALCNCLYRMLRAVSQQLNDEQLELWQRWISTLEGPCFPERDRGGDR